MPLPSWPAGVPYAPLVDDFTPIKRVLKPIVTEFEGGNQRQRQRPGDGVGQLGQTIIMEVTPFNTFTTWWKVTLNNGSARFTAPVWLGADYATKVCQFLPDGRPEYSYYAQGAVKVRMGLRVYDV